MASLDVHLAGVQGISIISDWSRAKTFGRSCVYKRERSNHNQPRKRVGRCCRIFYSVLFWLCYRHLLLKRHQKPSRTKRYPQRANQKTARFIPSPSHFNLCVPPSPLFAAMQPVFSAFLLSLPVIILAVLLSVTTPFFLAGLS